MSVRIFSVSVALAGALATAAFLYFQSGDSEHRKVHAVPAPEPTVLKIDQEDSGTPAAMPAVDLQGGQEYVIIPEDFRIGEVSRIALVDNLDQLLAALPQSDRELVENYLESYPHRMLSFDSSRQLEWLIKSGFPMPEEIVAADGMSEDQLRDLAIVGNPKAASFYLERKFSELQSEMDRSRADPMDFGDSRLYSELTGVVSSAMRSGTPFAGYMWGRLHENNPIGDGPAHVLAGLEWARDMGDWRARAALHEEMQVYAQAGLNVSAVQALAAYSSIPSIDAHKRWRAQLNHFPGDK